MTILNSILFAAALVAPVCLAQQASGWRLSNFSDRLELEVTNPSPAAVEAAAVVPVVEAARTALRFPGVLAIAVMPGPPLSILPSQADDLDGDGQPDEFVFQVKLAPRESRAVHIYYSNTLRDGVPWPKRVHASHAYGYNHATVALESELIGYRTYGGFFLDIQARHEGQPGLFNSLVGYFGARNPSLAGMDVIHVGDTLGLGGLFLRAGTEVFRPPLSTPDYAHKPRLPEEPVYRVIAGGPVRAVAEARMDRWTIGKDAVRIEARYSMAAGEEFAECVFRIVPLELSRTYEVGAGMRQLPRLETRHAAGRLALAGVQSARIGPLAMALYYNPAEAAPGGLLATKDGRNECVVFGARLAPGRAVTGRYQVAAAWSGSGVKDLFGHLEAIERRARATVRVNGFRHTPTPAPERLEGEAY